MKKTSEGMSNQRDESTSPFHLRSNGTEVQVEGERWFHPGFFWITESRLSERERIPQKNCQCVWSE